MVNRLVEQSLNNKLFKGKVITILGARQTGKTSLLKKLFSTKENVLWLNGDEYDIQERFKNATSTTLKALIGNKTLVIIDEAQRIENIGLALKLLIDNYPEIQIIATGSSSFELMNKMNEPLTGRKYEYNLFPFATQELADYNGELIENRLLNHRLVFGYYPEVVIKQGDEIETLKLLSDSYLYKDLLMLESIKKPEKLIKLLQALAYQIGNEISYNEIGNLIGLDSKTVETYISLLEKTFVIFRLHSFSRNLRNELKASKKVYFYDNGIRNAIISNFRILEGRQDIGALWENYLVSERKKHNSYFNNYAASYFWRTKEGQEIDYIEEKDGEIFAFEFKWNATKKHKITKTFINNYPDSKVNIITPQNYFDFVTEQKK
jgi:predicted AAA+ superfamily ATPase